MRRAVPPRSLTPYNVREAAYVRLRGVFRASPSRTFRARAVAPCSRPGGRPSGIAGRPVDLSLTGDASASGCNRRCRMIRGGRNDRQL